MIVTKLAKNVYRRMGFYKICNDAREGVVTSYYDSACIQLFLLFKGVCPEDVIEGADP